MAFSDIANELGPLSLRFFVAINVYNRTADTTTTLYFSDGQEPHTEDIDGALRAWDGRVGRWTITKPNQKWGTSRWAHPTATFELWFGDANDALWDNVGTSKDWEGQGATVYLAAYNSSGLVGVRTQIIGKTTDAAGGQQTEAFGSITIAGNCPDLPVAARDLTLSNEFFTGFVNPRVFNDYGVLINGASAQASTVTLSVDNAQGHWESGQVAMVADGKSGVGFGPQEAMYISGKNGAFGSAVVNLSVARAYAGTSASSHPSGQTVWLLDNGMSTNYAPTDSFDTVLPYVFGTTADQRGIVLPVWPSWVYPDSGGSFFAMYWTRGIAGNVAEAWRFIKTSGALTSNWTNFGGANINEFDDVTSSISPGPPSATPSSFNNIEPHFLPAGSYCTVSNGAGGGVEATGWDRENDKVWIRTRGIKSPGGSPYVSPPGIALYLAADTTWGNGLAAPFHNPTIQTWNTGDWVDEYTGVDYFDQIAGSVPEFRKANETIPNLADALHELCDIVNSDLFVLNGKWRPKRRKIANTADVTIGPEDLIPKLKLNQINGANEYANELRARYAQTVWTEPDLTAGDETPPEPIPWEMTIRNDAEITRRGGLVTSKTITRKWWRFNMTADWSIGTTQNSRRHLRMWNRAHEVQLSQRAQPQVWIEAPLPARFAYVEQGDTAQYDVSPFTNRKGQVREVRITGGGGRTASVLAKSLHIEF